MLWNRTTHTPYKVKRWFSFGSPIPKRPASSTTPYYNLAAWDWEWGECSQLEAGRGRAVGDQPSTSPSFPLLFCRVLAGQIHLLRTFLFLKRLILIPCCFDDHFYVFSVQATCLFPVFFSYQMFFLLVSSTKVRRMLILLHFLNQSLPTVGSS